MASLESGARLTLGELTLSFGKSRPQILERDATLHTIRRCGWLARGGPTSYVVEGGTHARHRLFYFLSLLSLCLGSIAVFEALGKLLELFLQVHLVELDARRSTHIETYFGF